MNRFFSIPEGKHFRYDHNIIENPHKVELHAHDSYEIFWFERGDVCYAIEGRNYPLHAGDIVITNPREMHCPVFLSDATYVRSLVLFHTKYLAEFVSASYNPLSALENRKIGTLNKIDAETAKREKLYDMMNEIRFWWESDKPERELMIKTYLLQLLVRLNSAVDKAPHSGNSEMILDVITYINDNISKPISLEMIAEALFVSKYYIAHRFKEKNGITIVEYITQKRIAWARELMMEGMSLGDVAETVGYNDYSSFYRAFLKVVGAAPSALK